jgi:hypothetical protein
MGYWDESKIRLYLRHPVTKAVLSAPVYEWRVGGGPGSMAPPYNGNPFISIRVPGYGGLDYSNTNNYYMEHGVFVLLVPIGDEYASPLRIRTSRGVFAVAVTRKRLGWVYPGSATVGINERVQLPPNTGLIRIECAGGGMSNIREKWNGSSVGVVRVEVPENARIVEITRPGGAYPNYVQSTVRFPRENGGYYDSGGRTVYYNINSRDVYNFPARFRVSWGAY